MRPRYTPAATHDLVDIAAFIARDSPTRAQTFVAELRQVCRSLARHPESAPTRFELAPALRCQPHRHYLIFFRPEAGGVLIVRILHSARHLPAAFASLTTSDDADPH